ncbi:MAG: glycosyltransferase family 2 protein [Deltaproteobacteria bacterium]|nr:glycosyltransferase family 2 protein [Deltaproteobacteria bacterium]
MSSENDGIARSQAVARGDQGRAGVRWVAGIVNHGSYDDLEGCLAALFRQSRPPSRIGVYDTGESPVRIAALRTAYPEIDIEVGPNRGYAGGSNRVVERVLLGERSADFVLLLNPDVAPDADYARILIEAMQGAPRVAVATGKLLRPDRRTLDSAGIVFPRHRRPRDRGSDQPDRGQLDRAELVGAASGAAMMLRVAALESLRVDGELFDESFFAYHEDTDLCWRARLLGWEILYEPRAVALHRRGWQRDRRNEIAIAIRRHSFKNHYLQLVKNETPGDFVRDLPWILGWEVLRLGFVLLRDRPMWAAYREAWRRLPEARRKRAILQARARGLERPGASNRAVANESSGAPSRSASPWP